MSTPFKILGVAIAGALVWAVMGAMRSPEVAHARVSEDSAPESHLSTEELVAHQAAYDRETQIRVQELTRLQEARTRRDLAAGKMASSRKFLQSAYAARWSTVLTTNWPAFMTLRQQAAHSPTREAPCTICGGTSRLPYCVVCSDPKGQCVSCRGSGRTSADEICPTCLGNRKCFLCFGCGEMPCPFCNEGMVDVHLPLPPNLMPIY